MDLGSNFAAKLEPFLLMAKSLKGAAAAKLIADATSAAGVFVFWELLELPNIQELAKSETHAKSLALLELFAYRTYEDYMQHKDALPSLNAAQTTKLKHLSIVSLASQRRILPYSDLLRALDMPTVRELEDLIIDAIYLDILRGRLDQKQEQLEVEYTMGRDLAPGAIDAVLAALRDWASTTASVLSTLDAKLAAVAAQSTARRADLAAHDTLLQNALREAAKDKGSRGHRDGRGGLGMALGGSSMYGGNVDSVMMDVDDGYREGENSKGKGRKTAPDSGKPVRKRNRPF
ncbi:hypothetical protein C8F04DRAFT_1031717 [Mycena alexandri]|uniref:PCI domain-containing protein n=1 Tax=Mycena alexandri TaxID=1745969 RepID=A0AAD6XAU8_9AGAR|nr:hypothetical protein C8F04DRAFT_1031717 [Mycena alexandri]